MGGPHHVPHRDGILIILPEMEVPREPTLDAAMLPHDLDEATAIPLVAVIQPTASVDHVILLYDAYAGTVGGGVGEYEYPPSPIGRMSPDQILEPIDLILVYDDLVTRVLGIPEYRRAQSHEESPLGHATAELGCILPVQFHHLPQIARVCIEFVDPLEVVIAAYHLVGHPEAPEEVGGHLVALGRARE